jgi:uncharacterized protein (TIGR02453 family)
MSSSSDYRFSEDSFRFLGQLARNNQRDWFETNKPRYEALVREPALAFISSMQAGMAELSPQFVVSAKKMGGSLMRVFRDTRFSNDKTPYKTNIGIQFRHLSGKDVHAPGFYIHLSPEECFLGTGLWHPESEALKSIRHYIRDNPNAWSKAIGERSFKKYFSLEGDSLQRMPRGFDEQHPHAQDLKRKDFIAVHNFAADEALKRNFAGFCLTRFRAAEEFMHTLCDAVDVAWD